MPSIIAINRNPIALAEIIPTVNNSTEALPPEFVEVISALTTAKIINPQTSSITAAPKMILDSILFNFFNSDKTLAVIPTLVAVRVAPMVKAASNKDVSEVKLIKEYVFNM